jgi:hypothetical protein
MNRLVRFLTALVMFLSFPINAAQAWDPQPTNPFPGVPFEGEIPGYTNEVVCPPGGDDSSSGIDCGIGIVPLVDCPPWSAGDGRNGYANDGPAGDPHKKIGVARRFCRNSWTPPTTTADDEDFRNRQQLATAAATLESQAFSASHPGEQKCVTWGPIVHANGISTASGGVCANVVGTKPDGTTAQVSPTQVGAPSSESTPAGSSPTDSSTTTSSTPIAPATNQNVDLTQFGIGKPFTRVVAGNLNTSQCPNGFQAASNTINTGVEYAATECWPNNAWSAYSVGGNVWAQFKSSNGSYDAQAETNRRIQINALRALALQQAQIAANETIGIKRCNSWIGYGESGQECAYIPIQNNDRLGGPINTSVGDTSTSTIQQTTEVGETHTSSTPGVSLTDWQASDSYTAISCPTGSGKSTTIDLNGTVSATDDVWITSCVQIAANTTIAETLTAIVLTTPETVTVITESAINAVPISYSGTAKQISIVAKTLDISGQELNAIVKASALLTAIKSTSKLVKINLPNSKNLEEKAISMTPTVCKIVGLQIQPKKIGNCLITYAIQGESGNEFSSTKKITFKK